MSIKVTDISAKLLAYLLSKSAITDLVEQRVFASKFPINTEDGADNEDNPKVTFRQSGGSPDTVQRYTFTIRADTDIVARQVAVVVANQLIEENFSIVDDSGGNMSYWAEIDSSLNDSIDDTTSKPEVFFNINFSTID